jgi:hypothetical protein
MAFNVVGLADQHGGLGRKHVCHERAFHFARADAVTGHVQHVIDAILQHPRVAVGILQGTGVGEVVARIWLHIRGQVPRHVRARPGQGFRIAQTPCRLPLSSVGAVTSKPVCGSRMTASIPYMGNVQLPGFMAVTPSTFSIIRRAFVQQYSLSEPPPCTPRDGGCGPLRTRCAGRCQPVNIDKDDRDKMSQ